MLIPYILCICIQFGFITDVLPPIIKPPFVSLVVATYTNIFTKVIKISLPVYNQPLTMFSSMNCYCIHRAFPILNCAVCRFTIQFLSIARSLNIMSIANIFVVLSSHIIL